MNICFTGHRPQKLGGYDYNNAFNQKIRIEIRDIVTALLKNNLYEDFHFIFGGALGVDQFSYDVVEGLKKEYPEKKIILEVAIPFKDQPNSWHNMKDRFRYYNQLMRADILTYVDTLDKYSLGNVGEYDVRKMQLRNKYMVDNSDVVIAVWDGIPKGGTYNCIKYADKSNKSVIRINPNMI